VQLDIPGVLEYTGRAVGYTGCTGAYRVCKDVVSLHGRLT